MRAEVADSWHLSAAAGVDAERTEAPITLAESDLRDHREAHPLARVFPLLDDVLGQAARECGAIMAVSRRGRSAALGLRFPVDAARGREDRLRRGLQLGRAAGRHQRPGHGARASASPCRCAGSEHFRHSVQHVELCGHADPRPDVQPLLGVLDITGGDDIVVPQTMAMVRAAARMAEAELARELLTRAGPSRSSPRPASRSCVELLGRHEALLTCRRRAAGHADCASRRATARSCSSSPRPRTGSPVTSSPSWSTRTTARPRPCAPSSTGCATSSATTSSRRGPTGSAAAVAGDWLAVEAQLAAGDVRRALRGLPRPGPSALDRARRRTAPRAAPPLAAAAVLASRSPT